LKGLEQYIRELRYKKGFKQNKFKFLNSPLLCLGGIKIDKTFNFINNLMELMRNILHPEAMEQQKIQ